MLSHADAALVSRDPELPGLATILDTEALARAFERETGKSMDEATLYYLRYKPHTNCLGAYRVSIGGEWTSLYAKAYRPDAGEKLVKMFNGAATHERRTRLEQECVVISEFPDDIKLKVLERLADPGARQALMARVFDDRPGMAVGELERLTYKPERRYVGRWTSQGGVALVKFYVGEARAAARTGWTAVSSREMLRIPQRCGGSTRHGVLAFEWLTGENLRDVLPRPDALPKVRLAGRALAELHAQSSKKVSTRDAAVRIGEVQKLVAGLGVLCPDVAERAGKVAERIAAEVRNEAPTTCIHGDLYDKQILIQSDCIGLIDLDGVAIGDPRVDLGLFLGHLDRDALMGRLPASRVAEVEEVLIDSYQEAGGKLAGPLSPYIAEALLHLVHHPFRNHLDNWPEGIGEIVDRAEQRLAEGCR
jgi:hypothetical protein